MSLTKKIFTITTLLLIGCSATNGVIRIDSNKYYISNSDVSMFLTNDTIINKAYEKANKYCERNHKVAETIYLSTEGVNSHDTGYVRYYFKCISKVINKDS